MGCQKIDLFHTAYSDFLLLALVPTFFKNKKFVNYKIEKLCLITERNKKGSCSQAGQGGTEAICTRLLMRS